MLLEMEPLWYGLICEVAQGRTAVKFQINNQPSLMSCLLLKQENARVLGWFGGIFDVT